MTPVPDISAPRGMIRRLGDRPYLLLSLVSLFWAGNIIVGRAIGPLVPPVMLSLIRWSGAFLLILPFAWPHLRGDWPAIRSRLGLMVLLALTGVGAYNTIAYWGLRHTLALNALLLQSAGPLFVAVWSLLLLGVRLTAAQAFGIAVSLVGVLVILLHGDLAALKDIQFSKGDVIFAAAMAVFGFYSVMSVKRPAMHPLSFLAFTIGVGALSIVPVFIAELASGERATFTPATGLALLYVAIFPSTLAYLFYNRGVALIGANRAAPFLHLIPVFGSVMAIVFLGERPQLFHAIGFALVLGGVFVAARRGRDA